MLEKPSITRICDITPLFFELFFREDVPYKTKTIKIGHFTTNSRHKVNNWRRLSLPLPIFCALFTLFCFFSSHVLSQSLSLLLIFYFSSSFCLFYSHLLPRFLSIFYSHSFYPYFFWYSLSIMFLVSVFPRFSIFSSFSPVYIFTQLF